MLRKPVARIDVSALKHNLARVREVASGCKVLAVLKANAYGHGMLNVAEQLQQADAFGVARLDEALALRAGGIVKPIVLLEGFFDADELPQIVASNLQVVVHQQEQIDAILAAELDAPIRVWLKMDTGMHRLGLPPEHYQAAHQLLSQSPNCSPGIRLMSHFACADDLACPDTTEQLQRFHHWTQGLSGEVSLANSAAVLGWPHSHGDWVRPGLMLYGVSPLLGKQGAEHDLQPVMTLCSRVIAVRDVAAGETVGYGSAWQAQQATRLAVVAIGYGDGYPRNVPNGTPVLMQGRRFPVVGRVSMDMLTVDIGDVMIRPGEQVVLWGQGLPVEEIAALVGTIPYELLCNITPRVDFSYMGGN
ncbi:alanine racemase [Alkalimonas mucilaginosa]|uniref:Alanine racemase n=1 Tax=Alkalimonas mucilaginosa TaxID=3057676 RepID=A0ABU7JC93_9GAMM|nr:alanine racemase [Alkalimonas sp. MEB004]MEE2023294.1 alanine racemase [Alkalimonas sp. MEB004]